MHREQVYVVATFGEGLGEATYGIRGTACFGADTRDDLQNLHVRVGAATLCSLNATPRAVRP